MSVSVPAKNLSKKWQSSSLDFSREAILTLLHSVISLHSHNSQGSFWWFLLVGNNTKWCQNIVKSITNNYLFSYYLLLGCLCHWNPYVHDCYDLVISNVNPHCEHSTSLCSFSQVSRETICFNLLGQPYWRFVLA